MIFGKSLREREELSAQQSSLSIYHCLAGEKGGQGKREAVLGLSKGIAKLKEIAKFVRGFVL